MRDAAFADFRADLASLALSVEVFLAAERAVEVVTANMGRKHERLDEAVMELTFVALRDAGLTREPMPFISAAYRARLLDRFGPLDAEPVPPGETVARCSICAHPERDAIEKLLQAGGSYRPLAAAYGLSKSALARHRQH